MKGCFRPSRHSLCLFILFLLLSCLSSIVLLNWVSSEQFMNPLTVKWTGRFWIHFPHLTAERGISKNFIITGSIFDSFYFSVFFSCIEVGDGLRIWAIKVWERSWDVRNGGSSGRRKEDRELLQSVRLAYQVLNERHLINP